MAVTVLMLQAFAGQGGAAGGAADQEAAGAHIGGGPDQIADALEAEHRVVNKKRDRIDPVIGVSGSGGDKGADRTGFGDAFLQNLPVFGFLVIKERVHIHRLVELAHARVNSHLAEERFHAEGAGFVRNDGHDQLADFRIAQQFREQAHENHGGRNFAAVRAFVKFLEVRSGDRSNRLGANLALRQVAAQLLAPLLHVADFRAVVRGTIEGGVVQFLVRDGNSEARTEHAQLVFVQLFLLVGNVLAFAGFAQSVALDGLGQNDGGRSLVLDRGFEGGVHFDGIVTAQPHA